MKPGLHYDLPMAQYIADPCPEPSLSASTIRLLVEQSPLKAWTRHPRLGGKSTRSKAADIGTAAHAMVLEGANVIQVVRDAHKADGTLVENITNWKLKEAQEARDEIRAAGKIALLQHEAAGVYAMAKAAGEAMLLEVGPGKPEVTIVWREENGIWCKARADWLPEKAVADYKTTKKSAEPSEWIRKTLYGDGYDISAAWYLRGLDKLGEHRAEYKFLVQEQRKPYDYSWIGFGWNSEALSDIQPWIDKAIRVWGECLKSGKWPGYSKHCHYADASSWRGSRVEESLLAEDLAESVFGDREVKGRFSDGI